MSATRIGYYSLVWLSVFVGAAGLLGLMLDPADWLDEGTKIVLAGAVAILALGNARNRS